MGLGLVQHELEDTTCWVITGSSVSCPSRQYEQLALCALQLALCARSE